MNRPGRTTSARRHRRANTPSRRRTCRSSRCARGSIGRAARPDRHCATHSARASDQTTQTVYTGCETDRRDARGHIRIPEECSSTDKTEHDGRQLAAALLACGLCCLRLLSALVAYLLFRYICDESFSYTRWLPSAQGYATATLHCHCSKRARRSARRYARSVQLPARDGSYAHQHAFIARARASAPNFLEVQDSSVPRTNQTGPSDCNAPTAHLARDGADANCCATGQSVASGTTPFWACARFQWTWGTGIPPHPCRKDYPRTNRTPSWHSERPRWKVMDGQARDGRGERVLPENPSGNRTNRTSVSRLVGRST